MTAVTGERTAAIVGLGLIGGSVARELAGLGWRVLAADADPGALDAARREGVAEPVSLDAPPPAAPGLVVVAVPVDAARAVLRRVGAWAPPDAVITDVASTKRTALDAARAAGLAPRFVGSHPLAGDHRSGWSAARAGLFRGARVWLCPAPESGDDALLRVTGLWRELGAEPAVIPAPDHDRLVAWASHLPQALASALAAVLGRAGVARDDLGPGGRDATRLAGSDPGLWRGILADNRDEVARAVRALADEVAGLQRALDHGDDHALLALLTAGRRWSDGDGAARAEAERAARAGEDGGGGDGGGEA